jgi:hypothetical protein
MWITEASDDYLPIPAGTLTTFVALNVSKGTEKIS